MRVLIVDDERPARDKLRCLLAQEADITAIDEARDGVEALERGAVFAPDAIFLDIRMPEVGGFDVAASLPEPAPLLVFVTAYDEYAVRAFDANAIDYLLKPYDQPRLQRALQRLRDRLAGQRGVPVLPVLPVLPVRQLLIPERGATRIVKVDDIAWIETADNYVILHTSAGAPLLRQTLAGLLDKLGPAFQRCHRRAAVRLAGVAAIEVDDKGDGELLLQGGTRAPLSRQYRPALLARLAASE
ncbi:two-component system response regulator [Massilia sp. Root351]|jgi:two-component system LytT family response regulator|uniref:LytR/AlgR family response regulator transcription factor n=1 Tax=Massilia sp. Root351 TaxID=1736522 RepID=UPI000710441B|nr:response regulator [Massilia sp. Root351]KQV87206.1 two-component system response regulator [Massilia sp. Root351]